jgi:antitoxin VapB
MNIQLACHMTSNAIYMRHMPKCQTSPPRPTVRVEWSNRSQKVTLPLEYRFPESVREVFIRREGKSVVLTPCPTDWTGFFASGMTASADFMVNTKRLPIQERWLYADLK